MPVSKPIAATAVVGSKGGTFGHGTFPWSEWLKPTPAGETTIFDVSEFQAGGSNLTMNKGGMVAKIATACEQHYVHRSNVKDPTLQLTSTQYACILRPMTTEERAVEDNRRETEKALTPLSVEERAAFRAQHATATPADRLAAAKVAGAAKKPAPTSPPTVDGGSGLATSVPGMPQVPTTGDPTGGVKPEVPAPTASPASPASPAPTAKGLHSPKRK